MKAKQLAMRDPALAAIMGVDFGSDFGQDDDEIHLNSDPTFGADFGADFGDDMGDDYGADFGDDMGADFGAAPARPTASQAMAVWKKHRQQSMDTSRRQRILEPNKHSAVKVERYAFTLSQSLVLGVASAISLTGSPDVTIRPQRVSMNAPTPMFATISDIRVANVSVTIGTGAEDAFDYNALGVGQTLDMPTISPQTRATVLGNYTGFVPVGFVGGATVTFSTTFKGPASMVA